MRSSPSPKVFVTTTISTFIFYLEVGLETPQKRTETRERFLQNSISSRGGPEKGTETRHEMKECKKTTLHLLCILGRCRVVFLHSFISCLVCVIFSGPSLFQRKFAEPFSLVKVQVYHTLGNISTSPPCILN